MHDELRRFDPRCPLAEAEAIPSSWYRDPSIYQLELSTIFQGTWQYMGPAEAVAAPGQYLSGTVGGDPVLVIRGDDGALRAMSNVCRHRAGPLVQTDMGRCTVLRCAYHGWTYSLDGHLKGTPDFDGVANFDKTKVCLPTLQVAQLGAFIFVHAGSPQTSPDQAWPRMAPCLSCDGLKFTRRTTYEVRCNWKVYIDNYLDGGYHIPFIHPGLMSAIDYPRYVCELHDNWNVQIAPMKTSPDPTVAATRRGDTALYYWAFPNLTVNRYEGVVDINHVVPLSVDRTAVIFDFFFDREERALASIEVADRIQEEDRRICEAVQERLGSKWYDRGRYSVRRENGGHQFHRLLAEALQR